MWFVTCLWFLVSNSVCIIPQASIDILRLYGFCSLILYETWIMGAPKLGDRPKTQKKNGTIWWCRSHSCHDECAFAVCVCTGPCGCSRMRECMCMCMSAFICTYASRSNSPRSPSSLLSLPPNPDRLLLLLLLTLPLQLSPTVAVAVAAINIISSAVSYSIIEIGIPTIEIHSNETWQHLAPFSTGIFRPVHRLATFGTVYQFKEWKIFRFYKAPLNTTWINFSF